PAWSTTTINVNTEIGPNRGVSAWLTAWNPFVAERSLYFTSADGTRGGTDVMGTPELKTAWYFAEGSTGPGFGETLTVLNPNPAATQTAVTYYPAGGQPKTVTHTVPPMSRQVIPVNEPSEAGSWQAVGVRVTADLPILAERAMTFGYGAVVGAHNVVGTSAPARSLNLAEGHVGGGFDEYLALLNANEVTTTATIRYVIPGGTTQIASLELPAGSRTTVHLNEIIAGTVD